jgi:hypothetical protein
LCRNSPSPVRTGECNEGGGGAVETLNILLYLSEIITGERLIIRESKPQAKALTTEARGVCVCFKILSPELRSGILLVTVEEEGFGFWQNIKPG